MRILRALLAATLILAACTPGDAPPPVSGDAPPDLADGAALFAANCQQCHGEKASGTEQGPPLVHRIYEPSHHGDAAFQMAVARGVRAHHWRFGDMAPVPGLSEPQVERIIAYVRWLQRQAGIE